MSVVFECSYNTDMDLESESFDVTEKTLLKGQRNSEGSLVSGFSLKTDLDSVILGKRMGVSVTWDITTLQNLSFLLKECSVAQENVHVNLVSGGCFASALQVSRTSQTTLEKAFSFRTFLLSVAQGQNYLFLIEFTIII